jgi:sirohydrochlorin ferrochelatase
VPLFLLAGVHVMDDIPAEVEQARQALPGVTLEVCPHLGSHPGIKGLLRQKLQSTANKTPILLAHGSRRPGGNDAICALAQALGGAAAFWAVDPSLESQVIHYMQTGVQRVAILPYFLFAGTTTDAITHLTEELAERFPKLGFHLLPPLGPSPELARLVIDLATGQVPTKAQQAPIPMQRVAFRHATHSSSMVS